MQSVAPRSRVVFLLYCACFLTVCVQITKRVSDLLFFFFFFSPCDRLVMKTIMKTYAQVRLAERQKEIGSTSLAKQPQMKSKAKMKAIIVELKDWRTRRFNLCCDPNRFLYDLWTNSNLITKYNRGMDRATDRSSSSSQQRRRRSIAILRTKIARRLDTNIGRTILVERLEHDTVLTNGRRKHGRKEDRPLDFRLCQRRRCAATVAQKCIVVIVIIV
jgi:hypothetical protein